MDIPSWLADKFGGITIGQVVIWVVVVVLIVWGAKKMWPSLKAIVQFADTWSKLPAFMQRTDDAIRKQSTQLDGIYHETHRNDGSSIKDSTVRLEEGVLGLHGRMDALEASNTMQESKLTDVQEKLTRDHDRLSEIERTLTPEEVARLKKIIKKEEL